MDRFPHPPLPPGHPMAQAHLMAGLNGPASLLGRPGLPGLPGLPGMALPGMPGMPGSNPQALLESYKQSYRCMHRYKTSAEQVKNIYISDIPGFNSKQPSSISCNTAKQDYSNKGNFKRHISKHYLA